MSADPVPPMVTLLRTPSHRPRTRGKAVNQPCSGLIACPITPISDDDGRDFPALAHLVRTVAFAGASGVAVLAASGAGGLFPLAAVRPLSVSVADATILPICFCNKPVQTPFDVSPESLAFPAANAHVAAIKETMRRENAADQGAAGGRHASLHGRVPTARPRGTVRRSDRRDCGRVVEHTKTGSWKGRRLAGWGRWFRVSGWARAPARAGAGETTTSGPCRSAQTRTCRTGAVRRGWR